MESGNALNIANTTRVTRIIVGALCMGIGSFGVFVVMQGLSVEDNESQFATLLAGVVTLGAILASLILPRLAVLSSRRQIAAGTWNRPSLNPAPSSDEDKLLAVFQTKTIVGAALYEGGAFMALIAFMTEAHPLALACAGVSFLGVLSHFPSADRIENFIDAQKRLLNEERQLTPQGKR